MRLGNGEMANKPENVPKRWLKAANDNDFEVMDALSDSLPVTEAELRLIETHLADIVARLIAANDNEP